MNVERLHNVFQILLEANEKHNFVSLLTAVKDTYTQSVATPNQPNAEAFDAALNSLKSAASEFPVGSLSPSRRKILENIGINRIII